MARKYLEDKGFKFLCSNYLVPKVGELDIVMKQGDVCVFIEVKTRKSLAYGSPMASISTNKIRGLKLTGLTYIRANGLATKQLRFDVVSICLNPLSITHFENAF